MTNPYVHGYDQKENLRLQDQASTLAELLHAGTVYPAGSRVLEAGCGVGAQTVALARNSPRARFTAVDISEASLDAARRTADAAGIANVAFGQANVLALPFADESFDHVFVCFLLEHLARPDGALRELKRVLRTGGTLTAIEGDHGSVYFHPESEAARKVIRCQVELQARAGGNALIGRELYPLLRRAGFGAPRVSPRMVYVDAGKPRLVEGFTEKTFVAMIEGVRAAALSANLVDAAAFDAGIAALRRTTEEDGVFCYTFFKGVAVK